MSDPPEERDVGDVMAQARPAQVDPMAEKMRRNVRRSVIGVTDDPVTIGRFEVRRRLGKGGMGTVYAAFDPKLEREVAVKVLESDGDAAQRRVLREARALAKVRHPNVIPVFDAETTGDAVYIAMELVDGQHLGRWLSRQRRSIDDILGAFTAAGRGLAAAHEAGLVHGDFKPENTLVDASDHVRVVDFGLARTASADGAAARTDDRPVQPFSDEMTLGATVTALTDARAGTPAYMAPEQIRGSAADARSDQFSFCVALYEALWGVRPFDGTDLGTLIEAVTGGHLQPPPENADVPRNVADAVLRGLAHESTDRHPSMQALLDALAAPALEVAPNERRRLIAPLIAVTIVALAAGAFIGIRGFSTRAETPRPAPDQGSSETLASATTPVAVITPDASVVKAPDAAHSVAPIEVATRPPAPSRTTPRRAPAAITSKRDPDAATSTSTTTTTPSPSATALPTRAWCLKSWPREKSVSREVTLACALMFRDAMYGGPPTRERLAYVPPAGGAWALRYTRGDLRRIIDHILAVCRGCPVNLRRVIEFASFESSARRALREPGGGKTIEPMLETILAGKPLTAAALGDRPLTALSLRKLRAAVHARHGQPLGHADLNALFYGDGPTPASRLLPMKRVAKSPIDEVGRATLALLRKQKPR